MCGTEIKNQKVFTIASKTGGIIPSSYMAARSRAYFVNKIQNLPYIYIYIYGRNPFSLRPSSRHFQFAQSTASVLASLPAAGASASPQLPVHPDAAAFEQSRTFCAHPLQSRAGAYSRFSNKKTSHRHNAAFIPLSAAPKRECIWTNSPAPNQNALPCRRMGRRDRMCLTHSASAKADAVNSLTTGGTRISGRNTPIKQAFFQPHRRIGLRDHSRSMAINAGNYSPITLYQEFL